MIQGGLHEKIMQTLEEVFKEYGVVVRHVEAEWVDVSTMAKKDFKLQNIAVDASYPGMLKPEEE